MKTRLLAAAALAATALTTPAWADGANTGLDSTQITVNANTPAKCDITSSANSVTLASYDITDDQGRAKGDIGNTVANALNALTITGWCTGANNSFALSRSALITGASGTPIDGFNTAAIYDIQVSIPNATRVGGGAVDEGTSDGAGSGPTIGHFGPTGVGEELSFVAEPAHATSAGVSNGQIGVEADRTTYTEDADARLVAGDYTGTVTIAVTPGV